MAAIHKRTPARPSQKAPLRFQGKVVNMHIAWCTELQGEGVSLGSDRTKWHGWNYFQLLRRSVKIRRRHNTDRRGCSSFDSGAHFHGRFTVAFARLTEACLSRKHKLAFSRAIWASQAGRREAGEHCTLLICSFWFKCFYNSLKAPLLWERKFESSCLTSLV